MPWWPQVAEDDVRFELFTTAGDAKREDVAAVADAASVDTVPMQVVLDGDHAGRFAS